MGTRAIERLAEAIGYPDRIPEGATSFILRTDGMEIAAAEDGRRLTLSYALGDGDFGLEELARLAAGRMLREDAALAYGAFPPTGGSGSAARAFIWQDAAADADRQKLTRLFETFADSCDWWRERVDGIAAHADESVPETMMIRP